MSKNEKDYPLGRLGDTLEDLGLYDDVQDMIANAAVLCIKFERARCAMICRDFEPGDPLWWPSRYMTKADQRSAQLTKRLIQNRIVDDKVMYDVDDLVREGLIPRQEICQ